ncbi:MAG: hypothetical protein WDZ49_14845, partial [Litorilinea sp.]
MKKRTLNSNSYTYPRFIRSLVRTIRDLSHPLNVALHELQPPRAHVLRELSPAQIVLMDLCLLGHQLAETGRLGQQAEILYRDITAATADQGSVSLSGLRVLGIKWIGKQPIKRLTLPGALLLDLYDSTYGTHHKYAATALYFRFSSLLVRGEGPGEKAHEDLDDGSGMGAKTRFLDTVRTVFMTPAADAQDAPQAAGHAEQTHIPTLEPQKR